MTDPSTPATPSTPSTPSTTSTSRPEQVRVLTWNVRGLLDDPYAVRRVIRSAAADLVCLQEAPQFPGSRRRLRALARDCDLIHVGGGRASAGTAILAGLRPGVTGVDAFRLPVPGWKAPRRGAVVITAGLPGTARFRLACIHLPLDADLRAKHLALIRARLNLLPVTAGAGPAAPRVVLCGDMNERPTGPSWTGLADLAADPGSDPELGVAAGPTFPVRGLRMRIDALLVGGLEVAEFDRWRPDPADLARASDHRPVLAVLTVPPA